MKGNPNKSNVRSKRQKIKEPYTTEDSKQKFSIDVVPIGKNLPSKESPDKPSSSKKSSMNPAQNQYPSQNFQLVQSAVNDQQQMGSASVILPINNMNQFEKIKTLQSENLTKI